jgi:DNA-binding LytR/AlgR family response regulator
MNILIIDDDATWQIKISMYLEEIENSHVHCCANTLEAIRFLAENTPDLIISDIILPDELIFEMKTTLLAKAIPCIFVSAAPIEKNYEQTKAFPNTRFLLKPFQALTLRATIDSLDIKPKYNNKMAGIFVVGKFRQKILVKLEEILWVDAEGNYSTVHTIHQKKYTLKKALAQIATDLDERFLQVQRAIYVNTEYINRIDFGQEKININGNILKIGRSYKSTIATYVNKKDYFAEK